MFKESRGCLSFTNEESLEILCSNHLESLFDLKLVSRQVTIRGERCDLLATDTLKKPYIIEFKNTEDRYVVQQLTRYYDALLEERPFSDFVDYTHPPRMIAVQPQFHHHNWIDRRYLKLSIDFVRFALDLASADKVRFSLENLDSREIREIFVARETRLNSRPADTSPGGKRTEAVKMEECQDSKLHQYFRLLFGYKYASKLGLKSLSLTDLEQKQAAKLKGRKKFKLRLKEVTKSGNPKFVAISVKSTIRVLDFYEYAYQLIPTVSGVITPNGVSVGYLPHHSDSPWRTYLDSDSMLEPLDIYRDTNS